jgi:cell division initiation protein
MRITPLDIQQKQFPVRFRGFHTEEVSAFLELIREEIEDLLRENASLKEQLQQTDDENRRFWQMEDQLGRILQEAHQIAEEYKVHGMRESDLVLKKAAERAEEIVGQSHEQVLAINEEIVELRMIRKRFHEEMQEVLGRFKHILADDREQRKEAISLHPLRETMRSGEAAEDTEPVEGTGELLPPDE